MRSSSRSQPPQRPRTLEKDLAAIGLITLAFLLFTSLLNAHREAGPLLAFLARVLTLSLGVGAWVVPLLCLGAAVQLGMSHPRKLPPRIVTGAVIVYVVFLAMVHMAAGAGTRPLTGQAVQQSGGFLGGLLAWLLARALGDAGTYIVLVGMALAGILMVAQSSWSEFLSGLGEAVLTLGRGTAAAVAKAVTPPRRTRSAATAGAGGSRGTSRRSARASRERPSRAERRAPSVLHDEDEDDAAQAEAGYDGDYAADGCDDAPEDWTDDDAGEHAAHKEDGAEAHAVGATSGSSAAASAADTGGQAEPDGPPATEPRPSSSQARPTDFERPENPDWQLPSCDLLRAHADDRSTPADTAEIKEQIRILEQTLLNFGIPARVRDYEHGPTITRFEVELEPGIRVSKVTQLQSDLAMALAAGRLRIEAPIPGKRAVGIEVPNKVRRIVSLRAVVSEEEFLRGKSSLLIALGKDVAGRTVVVDLENMPHLLVAGQTGSGKSVCLHTIVASLLMRATPDDLRLILIDPKRVEMTRYDGIPHLYAPVVYTLREAADVLRKTIREMQRRYDRFAVAGCANLVEYNQEILGQVDEKGEPLEPLPRIVVVIDELADLMIQARAEFEQSICRLAQLARATGIHVVIATQRPSVNVITGHIKANFPARIAMRLPAQHDSRTILDCVGADRLMGNGDMLLMTSELSKPMRVQGAFVDRGDVERLSAFYQDQGEPDFKIVPDVSEDDDGSPMGGDLPVGDELFEAAVRYVVSEQEASVSMLQRRFKVGYARAGRLIDQMERRGIVGPHEGSRPRRVMVGLHNVDEVLAGVRPATLPLDAAPGDANEEAAETPASSG